MIGTYVLGPGAWIILLQAAATYAAAASSYLLLRPLLRGQELDRLAKTVAGSTSPDPAAEAFAQRVAATLAAMQAEDARRASRENLAGSLLLAVSVALFSGALALQVATDSSFRAGQVPAAEDGADQPG